MDQRSDILGVPRAELSSLLERLDIGQAHANDVFAALHAMDARHADLSPLGPRKIQVLTEACNFHPVELVAQRQSEPDRHEHPGPISAAEKLLFRLQDQRQVEGVLLPQPSGRVSFCVSSQAGCGMGCRFCATATLGFERHLTAGEIVGQVNLAAARCAERGQRLSAVVFMGMGEPLHNYAALKPALEVLRDHHGLMLPSRGLTVSTVGLIPQIDQLAADFGGAISLALSLVAGRQATRERIIPTAKRYPLSELKAACLRYPRPGAQRAILLEYALLPGVNDMPEELDGVAEFVRGLPSVINLIPFNPFPGAEFRSPTDREINEARDGLIARGVKVTVRRPRGRKMYAACGQLARQNQPASAGAHR